MLSLIVFLPLAAALVMVAVPRLGDTTCRWTWVAVAAADLVLVVAVWLSYDTPAAGGLAFEEQAEADGPFLTHVWARSRAWCGVGPR